jgi:hypothetical protein
MSVPLNDESQDELLDQIAKRMVALVGNNPPIKRVRRSQLLSALVGAVGFALFASGVEEVFTPLSAWSRVLMGFVLMVLTGLLLQNLNR